MHYRKKRNGRLKLVLKRQEQSAIRFRNEETQIWLHTSDLLSARDRKVCESPRQGIQNDARSKRDKIITTEQDNAKSKVSERVDDHSTIVT